MILSGYVTSYYLEFLPGKRIYTESNNYYTYLLEPITILSDIILSKNMKFLFFKLVVFLIF